MNALLTEYLILGTLPRYLGLLLVCLLGAGLWHRFDPLSLRLTRSRATAATAAVLLLAGLLPAPSLLLPRAALSDAIWVVVAAEWLLMAALGAGLYGIGTARARDISGTRRKAWFAIVPGLNLYLLCKPPGHPRPATPTGQVIMLMCLSVALLLAGRSIDVLLTRATQTQYFPRPLEDVVTQLPPVPAAPALTTVARLARVAADAQVPQEIEEDLFLVGAQADGATLEFLFRLDVPDFPPFPAEVRDRLAQELCRDPEWRQDLIGGARIVYRYENREGRRLATIAATRDIC